MRVLFTAAAEVGHIAPLLGVAAAVRDAGHDVRLATHRSRHELVAGAGIEPVSAGLDGREVNAERQRRWPETIDRPATEWGVRMWMHVAAPAMAADLDEVIAAWRPDVVVHEEGEYGGPAAAARAGLRWVTHAWGSPLRPADELRQLEDEARGAGLWGLDVEPPPAAGLYAHAVINPCPPRLDVFAAPPRNTWPVRISVLGAGTGPPPAPTVRNRCYIGFGTVPAFANARSDIFAAAEAALEAGLDVVATVPDAELRSGLAALGVDARAFVSLPELLPSCALAVSHGGAGTTVAALAHGTPVVVVPRGTPSQERMAAAVAASGAGVSARGATEIRAAVVAARAEPVVSAAAAVAREIATMPEAASVVPRLEACARRG